MVRMSSMAFSDFATAGLELRSLARRGLVPIVVFVTAAVSCALLYDTLMTSSLRWPLSSPMGVAVDAAEPADQLASSVPCSTSVGFATLLIVLML